MNKQELIKKVAADAGITQKQALAALERVGLKERARHLPAQLSGGEQQRCCIARALINYPALILADEPTGNLDEANEKKVLEIFKQLHDEGSTLIVVTHDIEVAEQAQRTIVLEHGRLAKIVENEAFGGSGANASEEEGYAAKGGLGQYGKPKRR